MKVSLSIVLLVFGVMTCCCQTGSKLDFLTMNPQSVQTVMSINLNLCKPTLGAMCRIENKQSNKKLFNYRARLGTLDYVNTLERK